MLGTVLELVEIPAISFSSLSHILSKAMDCTNCPKGGLLIVRLHPSKLVFPSAVFSRAREYGEVLLVLQDEAEIQISIAGFNIVSKMLITIQTTVKNYYEIIFHKATILAIFNGESQPYSYIKPGCRLRLAPENQSKLSQDYDKIFLQANGMCYE